MTPRTGEKLWHFPLEEWYGLWYNTILAYAYRPYGPGERGAMGLNIVVLAGGLSGERDVSLSSGAKVTEALRERGHRVALVDLYMGLEDYDCPPEELYDAPVPERWRRVAPHAPDLSAVRAARRWKSPSQIGPGVLELCAGADVVYLGLHGTCGEDGRVQAMLDLMGIPYTGSGYLGSALAMDKDLTKRLAAGLVRTPAWRTVRVAEATLEEIAAGCALPCVVKPLASGSSIGVSIPEDGEALREALREVIALGGDAVIEEYIRGRELQVAVLDGVSLPSIEIIPREGFYDYANKYQPGAAEEVCPANIPAAWEERLRRDALTVYRALGLAAAARADFIVTEDGTPYFLEINTLPGMTPTSLVPQEAAVVGIGYGELCERIITASLRARKEGK